MFNFLKKRKKPNLKEVAEQQLKENRQVLESLRDYDAGKKDISISNLKRRLPHIQTTS